MKKKFLNLYGLVASTTLFRFPVESDFETCTLNDDYPAHAKICLLGFRILAPMDDQFFMFSRGSACFPSLDWTTKLKNNCGVD